MTQTALHTGDEAPDFSLPTQDGTPVRLSDYRGRRVVLYFYPADDTPGCTAQACSFRDAYPQIQEQNAEVLGVSQDPEESHRRFRSKYNLPFTLLVDADHKVAEHYGAWGEKHTYGKTSVGLIRSQFVIDEQGRLADIQVPVKPAEGVGQALKVLAG